MAGKKLSFAIFGSNRQALETAYIWEVLDYLTECEAQIFIEERFYENLCKVLNKKVEVAGVIKGED